MDRRAAARRAAFYVAIVASWQAAASAGALPDGLLPSPWEVAEDIARGAADSSLIFGVATTLWRLMAGLAIAIGAGVALGVAMARVRAVNETVGSLVLGLQSIPSIAWVPVALIWFGVSDAGIVFVTAVGAVFAVTTSIYSSVRNIPPHYLEAARNMGARGGQLVTRVLLPAAFPHMISGFKQGWAFAWRGVVGAEMLFSFLGLGFLLNVGRHTVDISQVVAVLVVIMAMGMAVDAALFRRIEDRVRERWGLR